LSPRSGVITLCSMTRELPASHPFRITTADRRDRFSGEGVKWYDRAVWLRGRILQIPSNERTLYQTRLDQFWVAVECFEHGTEAELDLAGLEKRFAAFFDRWPDALGQEIPPELS